VDRVSGLLSLLCGGNRGLVHVVRAIESVGLGGIYDLKFVMSCHVNSCNALSSTLATPVLVRSNLLCQPEHPAKPPRFPAIQQPLLPQPHQSTATP
jgi:hypothetical protein